MAKSKSIVAKNSAELSGDLGLSASDGLEFQFRSQLNAKIVELVKKRGLTYTQVAELVGTSRTRVTAILNFNSRDILADLMLRFRRRMGSYPSGNEAP